MANKKDTSFSLKTFVDKEASTSEEGIANWAMTVIQNGFFRSLPTWIHDIDIPPGTQKSALSDIACLNRLNAYYKANPKILHPQKILESKLAEGSVQFTPKKITDMDGNNLKITRGYILPGDLKDELSVVAPAIVATSLAYHVDYDAKGKQVPTADKKEYARLGWDFPDLSSFRNSLGNTTRSKNVSQAEMYAQVVKDSAGAIHMMCGIYSKVPRFCIPANEGLTNFMNMRYDVDGVQVENRYPVVVPKGIVIKTMKATENLTDKMWNYLNDCRMKRGEDGSGRGPLSMGYYFCDMPRSLIKDLSLIYDLRALMIWYGVKTIQIPSTYPEYVKRALVLNGYSVVSIESINLPAFNKDVPGIYRNVPASVSMIILKNMQCDRPDVAGKTVTYPVVDLDEIKNDLKNAVVILGNKKSKGNRYVLSKLPLIPKLANDLALFPSTSPHNGYVWVGSSYGTGTYDYEKLVLRSLNANTYRNQYVLNRVNYWTLDPVVDYFHLDDAIKLPKLSIGKTKIDNSPIYEFVDEGQKILDQEPLKIDISAMIDKVVEKDCYKAGSLGTVVSYFSSMMDSLSLKGYILAQYGRYANGNDVHSSLRDIFVTYEGKGMETVYQAFGFSGFNEDYKFYLDSLEEQKKQRVQKGKDEKGKSPPPVKEENVLALPEVPAQSYQADYGFLEDEQ